ncbi:hypothetical protein C8Q74DRAFT_85222 [Fomes fomentarius]|nr:hypothetical protein C8Q74DRAFT_85222 [Fomes fomentarius]
MANGHGREFRGSDGRTLTGWDRVRIASVFDGPPSMQLPVEPKTKKTFPPNRAACLSLVLVLVLRPPPLTLLGTHTPDAQPRLRHRQRWTRLLYACNRRWMVDIHTQGTTISHTDSGHKLRYRRTTSTDKHPSSTAVNLPGLARLPAHGVVSQRGLRHPTVYVGGQGCDRPQGLIDGPIVQSPPSPLVQSSSSRSLYLGPGALHLSRIPNYSKSSFVRRSQGPRHVCGYLNASLRLAATRR